MNKAWRYIIISLVILTGLWLIPYGVGYSATSWINQQKNPIKIDHLVIGFNRLKADQVVLQASGYDIQLSEVSVSYAPWRWLFQKPSIDVIHIKQLNVNEAPLQKRQQAHGKTTGSMNWIKLISVKALNIDQINVFGQSLGHLNAVWLPEKNQHVLNLKLVNEVTTTAQITIPKKQAPIGLSLHVLDLKLQGLLHKEAQGWVLQSKDFGQHYPKGVLIQTDHEEVKVIDLDEHDQLIGLFGAKNRYLHWSTNLMSIDYMDDLKQMSLKINSQYWRFQFKHAPKQLEGKLHLNQYPLFGYLISGDSVFSQRSNQDITGSINLKAYKHPEQIQLTGHWVFHDQALSGDMRYHKNQGEYLNIHAVLKNNQLQLKESGQMFKEHISAKQVVDWHDDQVLIQWLSLQIGATKWQALQDTRLIDEFAGKRLTETCFTDQSSQQLCFNANFPNKVADTTVQFNYKNDRLLNFDFLSPDLGLLYDLKFKGGFKLVYHASKPMPVILFNVEDMRFNLDPLAEVDLPIKGVIQFENGHGQVRMDDQGHWTYGMHFQDNHSGSIEVSDQNEHFLQARGILAGIKEQSHLIMDVDADWDQQKQTAHFDVNIEEGAIQMNDYYDSVSNPMYVYHKMLPIWLSLNIKNKKPIDVDILGLAGQVNIDLGIQEQSSIWLANGKIKMLPGGQYRKWKPVAIKEAQVMFYKSNLMNPFVQLVLEKKQTLLSNETNISTYKEQILGVRFYGQLNEYQMQTYSIPAGVSDFVILQTVLLNPMMFSADKKPGKSHLNLASAFAESLKTITHVLPIDQIYLQPAKQSASIIDNRSENSSVSIMKRLSRSIAMYARFGTFPQDNIFSVIFRPPNRSFGTQLYSNYQSQGINLVFSH